MITSGEDRFNAISLTGNVTMNAVYKLIFNIATGTWSVAHELASARGRKSRSRLAAAMAAVLGMPFATLSAAESPQHCAEGDAVAVAGQRCHVAGVLPISTLAGIGTQATDAQNRANLAFGTVHTGVIGPATAGNYATVMGGGGPRW